jgi:hypothetical protein
MSSDAVKREHTTVPRATKGVPQGTGRFLRKSRRLSGSRWSLTTNLGRHPDNPTAMSIRHEILPATRLSGRPMIRRRRGREPFE